MSRIGKLPVQVPSEVEVKLQGNLVHFKGPKGSESMTFDAGSVSVELKDDQLLISPLKENKFCRSYWGTVRSILSSLVKGVCEEFTKNLTIEGVGFKAAVSGKKLTLNLGYSHIIEYEIPEGIIIVVTDNTKLLVKGTNKQKVGQVAASIKSYYPVEPYKGKGVRIDGEFVIRKEGKKTA